MTVIGRNKASGPLPLAVAKEQDGGPAAMRAHQPGPKPAPASARPSGPFDPNDVFDIQNWLKLRNKVVLPEDYGSAVREELWRELDARGVVYPPIEDEAHVNGSIRTTYASVDRRTGVIVVGLDNAAYHTKGYEGLSPGERRFAQDMAEYGKRNGLTTIFLDHLPPIVKMKYELPDEQERAALIAWMNDLRRQYPDSLWVHGHAHPDLTDLQDLNGRDLGSEVSNVVLSGQVKNSVTRITTYPNGRRIEEFKLVESAGGPSLRRVQDVVLSRSGQRVDAASHRLGPPKGVLYGISDVHGEETVTSYFTALRQDAEKMQKAGLPVSYLDAGDHTVRRQIPVELPDHGNYYLVVGNHDYYNHRDLDNVVASLEPPDRSIDFRIQYRRDDGA